MNNISQERIDEIYKNYSKPAEQWNNFSLVLFWINTFLSFLSPYLSSLGSQGKLVFQLFLFAVVVMYFVASQYLSVFLVPRAYLKRREQLLSDAFNTPITPEVTRKYYDNSFPPSIHRLAANVMESSFFTKELTERLLLPKLINWRSWRSLIQLFTSQRIIVPLYLFIWVCICVFLNDFEIITNILRLIFSAEICVNWLKIEVLRSDCEKSYEGLYQNFRRSHEARTELDEPDVFKHFSNYEAAKSSAGIWILLPENEFLTTLNPALTESWRKICQKLHIP
jgi:hypothetical protein